MTSRPRPTVRLEHLVIMVAFTVAVVCVTAFDWRFGGLLFALGLGLSAVDFARIRRPPR